MSSPEFWKDSEIDEPPMPTGLAATLEEVTALDKRRDELKLELKRIEARRSRLEDLAVEELTASGIDGVKVAGRSWRVEMDHHLSVPMDRRDAVLEAARGMGLDTDVLTQVNTARLKSVLREAATEAGKDTRRPFSEGTALEGLVSEFTQSKLRHRSV